MRIARLFIAALLLASCVDEGQVSTDLSTTERQTCEAEGGRLGHGGTWPGEICFRPQPDAGKACSSKSDCTGICMADTKTCSAESPTLGCFHFLDQDGQKQEVCVD